MPFLIILKNTLKKSLHNKKMGFKVFFIETRLANRKNQKTENMKIRSRRELANRLGKEAVNFDDLSKNLIRKANLWIKRGEVILSNNYLTLSKKKNA